MKFVSLEHYCLNPRKLAAVAAAVATGAAAFLQFASGGVLGQGGVELDAIVASLVFYMVVSMPRRMMEASSLSQSKEAPTLAVMAAAGFETTHSRARTVMMLRSADPEVSSSLTEVKRKVLLGSPVETAVEENVEGLASFSVSNILREAAAMTASSIQEGGEEAQGIMNAFDLAEESKLPLFIAACFFTPILLLLYAMFARLTSPESLVELVVVQIVLLDLGFYFSSTQRGRMS